MLHLVHGVLIAGVLADVVTNFDGGLAADGRKLDDDVERRGFGVCGGVGEVV